MARTITMTESDKENARRIRELNAKRQKGETQPQKGKKAKKQKRPLQSALDPKGEVVIRDGMSYADYLRTPHWLRSRNSAIQGANGRCECCGIGYRLQVHHLSYQNVGNERCYDVSVLCSDCHKRAHDIM